MHLNFINLCKILQVFKTKMQAQIKQFNNMKTMNKHNKYKKVKNNNAKLE